MADQIKISTVLYTSFNGVTNELEYGVTHNRFWVSSDDIILDTDYSIYITPPELSNSELMVKAIESLKAKQKKIRDDAYIQEAKLQEKINSMLAISHVSD